MTDLLSPDTTDTSTSTSTLEHHDTDRTRNLTGFLRPDRARRPDATGEFPTIQAETAAETAMLDQPAVLVLPPEPVAAEPEEPAPMTAVQQARYRARHRMSWPLWVLLTVVGATAFGSGALGGVAVLVAAVILAGGPR